MKSCFAIIYFPQVDLCDVYESPLLKNPTYSLSPNLCVRRKLIISFLLNAACELRSAHFKLDVFLVYDMDSSKSDNTLENYSVDS